jgi:hypothetical protein
MVAHLANDFSKGGEKGYPAENFDRISTPMPGPRFLID